MRSAALAERTAQRTLTVRTDRVCKPTTLSTHAWASSTARMRLRGDGR